MGDEVSTVALSLHKSDGGERTRALAAGAAKELHVLRLAYSTTHYERPGPPGHQRAGTWPRRFGHVASWPKQFLSTWGWKGALLSKK